VNRVPFSWNEQNLRDIFSKFGPVRSVKIKKPTLNTFNPMASYVTTAYAIAYVDFEKEEDA
jgi:RNA recognition motif-containing protein